jgi:hypothetical protein
MPFRRTCRVLIALFGSAFAFGSECVAAKEPDTKLLLVAAVSGKGCWLSLDHGMEWTAVPPPDAHSEWPTISNLQYDGRQFLAVSRTGNRLFRSLDGVYWSAITVLQVSAVVSVPNRNGQPHRHELVSEQGIQFGSPLPSLSEPVHLDFPNSNPPRLVLFGEGEAGPRFVFVGLNPPWRASSENGQTLLSTDWLPEPVMGAAYGAGRFVMAGAHGWIESSQDAQIWVSAPRLPATLRSLVWSGQRFLACSDAAAWESEDGIVWAPLPENIPAPIRYASESEPRRLFVAAGSAGTWVSTDAATWIAATRPLPIKAMSLGFTAEKSENRYEIVGGFVPAHP